LLCAIQSLLFIQKKFIELFDTGNYNEKETSKYRAGTSSFHFRGLLMLRCRSPPFFCLKTSRQKENGELEMKKEYYLYVDGQKVKVSEEIYKVYWREEEHEKYLEQVDRKKHLLFFSSLDHDGHFSETIVDEAIDVENIVETKIMIEAVKNAISMLSTEERDIIECLYFNDETLSSIARRKKVSYQAIQWRKNSILKKLRLLLEEILK
jgi:putative sigma factor